MRLKYIHRRPHESLGWKTPAQRRAENLGGRLSIRSNQPTGVHLHLELPTEAVA